jgi:hypothetical protein
MKEVNFLIQTNNLAKQNKFNMKTIFKVTSNFVEKMDLKDKLIQ